MQPSDWAAYSRQRTYGRLTPTTFYASHAYLSDLCIPPTKITDMKDARV